MIRKYPKLRIMSEKTKFRQEKISPVRITFTFYNSLIGKWLF